MVCEITFTTYRARLLTLDTGCIIIGDLIRILNERSKAYKMYKRTAQAFARSCGSDLHAGIGGAQAKKILPHSFCGHKFFSPCTFRPAHYPPPGFLFARPNERGAMALQTFVDTRKMDAGLQYATMSHLLLDFRRYIEREAGQPIERIELNGALWMNDLCRFLRLGEGQRERVLGKSAVAYVEQTLDGWVGLIGGVK